MIKRKMVMWTTKKNDKKKNDQVDHQKNVFPEKNILKKDLILNLSFEKKKKGPRDHKKNDKKENGHIGHQKNDKN